MLLVSAVVVVVAAAAFVGIARATDRPAFCGTCHEMSPYAQAHATGVHRNVACIECHVDTGTLPRLEHKLIALKEVRDHFLGDPRFPLAASALEPIPNERCVHCHQRVVPAIKGLDHARHAAGRACVTCHAQVGHSVSATALATAGVLNAAGARLAEASRTAAPGAGTALPGHVGVACSNCHDMPRTPCAQCHTPKHKSRGACGTCHRPGVRFVFTHPKRPDCTSCHNAPAKHRSGTCTTCHTQPGVAWSFTHPRSTACAACHARPAGHRPGTCTTCHRAGVSWRFAHPGSSARCLTCHTAPGGHRTSGCTSCHRVGASWAFRHPASSTCASCHKAPSGHYGSTCSSCHSPSRAWRNATFRHPGIPGGQHTFRSFSCLKCHPSRPPRVYCTCHNGNAPTD